jgi:hypothetical protein
MHVECVSMSNAEALVAALVCFTYFFLLFFLGRIRFSTAPDPESPVAKSLYQQGENVNFQPENRPVVER